MSGFFAALKNSLEVFSAHPKMILPKLIIAILYSFAIIFALGLFEEALNAPSVETIIGLLGLLIGIILIGILDILVGAMYPFMVSDAIAKKNVSLQKAIKEVFSNTGKIIFPVLAVEAAFLVLIVILSAPLSYFIVSEDAYSILFSGLYAIVVLGVVFFFYHLYPVVVFEKRGFFGSLKRSIDLSLKNRSDVAKASVLSFILSLLSFAIAASIEFLPQGNNWLFFGAFLVVRFLTAYVYTYLYILNPVFYLQYVKQGK